MSTVRDMKPGDSLWVHPDNIALMPEKGRCVISLDAETFVSSEDPTDVVVYKFSPAVINLTPTGPHWTCVGSDLTEVYTLDLTSEDVVEANAQLLPIDVLAGEAGAA